jgi:DNA-binding MarR family transcriptional regulator
MQNEEVRRVVSALEGVVRLLMTAATAGELSLPAASVLGRLVREGPQRLTELAIAERVSQPAMTQLVARLEREGFAAKHADHSDGRAVLVAITARGRRVVDARRRERATVMGELLSALDDRDGAAVVAAVPALHRLAEASELAARRSHVVAEVGA